MRFRFAAVLVSTLLVSCAGGSSETTTTISVPTTTSATTVTSAATTSTTESPPQVEKSVYFFFDGYPVEPGPYLVPVARSGENGLEGALQLLLAGVSASEAETGLSSAIPDGTRLLGVSVSNGVAAVDLSREFESGGGSLSVLGRVAQIVYTATRFTGVDGVEFLIEGTPVDVITGEGLIVDEPQTRAGYVDLLPAILIEQPTWGAAIETPVTISGEAMTESGVVEYVVVDGDGVIVAEDGIEVAEPGQRSSFSATIELPSGLHPGAGSIIVFELASDGTQLHVLEYPLTIGE